jgi:hypothetical protein
MRPRVGSVRHARVGGNTRFGDIDKFSAGRQVPLGGITLSCSMAACLPAATGAPAHPPFLHLQCSPVDKIRLPSPEFQICESEIPVVSVRVSALLFYSLFYTDEGAIKRERASEMRERRRGQCNAYSQHQSILTPSSFRPQLALTPRAAYYEHGDSCQYNERQLYANA